MVYCLKLTETSIRLRLRLRLNCINPFGITPSGKLKFPAAQIEKRKEQHTDKRNKQ